MSKIGQGKWQSQDSLKNPRITPYHGFTDAMCAGPVKLVVHAKRNAVVIKLDVRIAARLGSFAVIQMGKERSRNGNFSAPPHTREQTWRS